MNASVIPEKKPATARAFCHVINPFMIFAEKSKTKKKVFTYEVGRDENRFLYCSNVKNLVARFGVSAMIGGRIPL